MLKESTIDASVGEGLGGAITVVSRSHLDIENSLLDTSSEIGFSGAVNLNAETRIDPTGTTISATGVADCRLAVQLP